MAQQVEPRPKALASHLHSGSSPTCSTSDPAHTGRLQAAVPGGQGLNGSVRGVVWWKLHSAGRKGPEVGGEEAGLFLHHSSFKLSGLWSNCAYSLLSTFKQTGIQNRTMAVRCAQACTVSFFFFFGELGVCGRVVGESTQLKADVSSPRQLGKGPSGWQAQSSPWVI